MTKETRGRVVVGVVAVAALTEAIRLLLRLHYGSVGHILIKGQLVLLCFLLLRAATLPWLTGDAAAFNVQTRPWWYFYIAALVSLLIDSFWNLCLMF